MNIHNLRKAQIEFNKNLDKIISKREDRHKIRKSFIDYFNIDFIKKMRVDDYVSDVKNQKDTDAYSFCYFLERKLDGLGRITGAPSHKFGLWYGHNGKGTPLDFYYVKRFGDNQESAFEEIRKTLIELLEAGEKEDLNVIVKNKFSPMFKGKILSTYFPDRYLNVFSSTHIDYFLVQFDVDNKELLSLDPVYKREALLKLKNEDSIMKDWTTDLFAHFLYVGYPKSPKEANKLEKDILIDYQPPKFPTNYKAEFINLTIDPSIEKNNKPSSSFKQKKKDYEKEARKLIAFGDRGEKIIMELEEQRLREAGREDLAQKN